MSSLYYSATDAVAVPSREEVLPNVLREAMACGRPSVAFDIGGSPEAIEDGRTGFIAPAFSADAFADALDRCLGDRSLWCRLCEAARARALREYAIDDIAQRYRDIYDELLASSARDRRSKE